MHHALEIQEIILDIFAHCRRRPALDLFALARTCRAFRESALDLLWEELNNASPLARCLPDATCQSSRMNEYSFIRPLTQLEWDILRSYTRRIRIIVDFGLGLDWDSVATFLKPPTTESLFPNLRQLRSGCYATNVIHLLHLPLPSLISLDLAFQGQENLHMFRDSLETFHRLAPKIKKLSISMKQPGVVFNDFFSCCISRWRTLQDVHCPEISLDADTFLHLSRIPALTRLAFALSTTLPDQIAPPDSPLTFSNLNHLELHSESLVSVSNLLPRTRLPVITGLSTVIKSPSFKRDVSSFLAAVGMSCVGRTIQGLQLVQVRPSTEGRKLPLGFKDLRPCMAFNDLRRMNLDIGCDVVLSDSEVLVLTSAWPRLENFTISH